MSNPSPTCLVNNASTLDGVNVTATSTVTIKLADTAAVKQWSISCLNTDELISAATITAGLTIDTVQKQATFAAPGSGSAMVFQSVVNNGKDNNGNVDPTLTTTFGIYVLTGLSYRTGAFGEKTEGSAQYGWASKLNPVIRNAMTSAASAGNGILYNTGAYSVKPDAEGSIVVTAAGVKVGVLASDAEHGNRGNGSLHSVADATHNGFLTAAFFSLLNGATNAATNSTLVKRGAAAQCSFGALDCGTFEAGGAATFDDVVHMTGGATILAGVSIDSATFSPAITGIVRIVNGTPEADPSFWACTTAGTWNNLTIGKSLFIPCGVDLPNGCTVTGFACQIDPANTHAGNLPATMPTLALKYYDTGSNLVTTVDTATDTSGSAAAYETIHTIVKTGLSHTVVKSSRRYYLELVSEDSTHAQIGTLLTYASVTFTRPNGSNIGLD